MSSAAIFVWRFKELSELLLRITKIIDNDRVASPDTSANFQTL